MSKIASNNLTSVFYLYKSHEDAVSGTAAGGTGFFVQKLESDNRGIQRAYIYALTNIHVIANEALYLRINRKNENTNIIIHTTHDNWISHPCGDDVCALRMSDVPKNSDVSAKDYEKLLTREMMLEDEVGLGDNVFMVGRQAGFEGREVNEPVIRFGSVSKMPIGKGILNSALGIWQESFVCEMLSANRYSGSVVVIRYANYDGGRSKILLNSDGKTDIYERFRILGINWGHIQTKQSVLDSNGNDTGNVILTNTNMACVVPAWKIKELIDDQHFVEDRARLMQVWNESPQTR